jgi:16S rRNA (adenine1518-N6/adenine1519-N6)-dimethyltransferase
VESAVVRLPFREEPLVPVPDDAFFRRVVRTAFARRRKTLLNNFKDFGGGSVPVPELMAMAGIDGGRRGETLTVEEFGRLAKVLRDAGDSGRPDGR